MAVDLAQRAGQLLVERQDTVELAATKSSPTDAVTDADRAAEALILSGLRQARPGDGVIGEEGARVEGTTGIRWVVDPLDGTVNYLYRHPTGWSVSIGAEDAAGGLVGVVHDPRRDETFTAVRSEGASCNGQPCRVSTVDRLAGALVGTGFSYEAAVRTEQAEVLRSVLPAVRDIRRAGSAALDLCWVAHGRLDGFFERMLQPWDWVAGALIVAEAGGVVSHHGDLTVAGGPAVHAALTQVLRVAPGPR